MTFIFDSLENILKFARSRSLWPMLFSTCCCGMEVMHCAMSKYDINRFGVEMFHASVPQADLLICAGTVTSKSAALLVDIYKKMSEPKYVIAVGSCACAGGVFAKGNYNIINGVDKLIPVDIYLPMCPPKPEAIIDAFIKLREKIHEESHEERRAFLDAYRPEVVIKPGSEIPVSVERIGD